MPRRADWPAQLGGVVEQRLAMPFAWNTNHCAGFVADCALAMHGSDVLVELRQAFVSERRALRAIKAGGGMAAALARAGLSPVAPALAQRGDVVEIPIGRRRVLAICLGDEAAAPGPDGLERAPMALAEAAWRL